MQRMQTDSLRAGGVTRAVLLRAVDSFGVGRFSGSGGCGVGYERFFGQESLVMLRTVELRASLEESPHCGHCLPRVFLGNG